MNNDKIFRMLKALHWIYADRAKRRFLSLLEGQHTAAALEALRFYRMISGQ